MGIILLNWIYTFAISYIYGIVAIKWLTSFFKLNHNHFHLSIVNVIGLILVNSFASIFSFFLEIGIILNIVLTLFAIVFYFKYKSDFILNKITYNRVSIILTALIIITSLAYSCQPSRIIDDFRYYHQFIKWTENFRTLPGLANINSYFGLNSSWHLLSAVFSFKYLYDLNGYIFALYAIFCINGINNFHRNKILLSSIIKVFSLVFLIIYINFLSAPSPDLVVIIISSLILILLVEYYEETANNFNLIIIIVLATYLLTVKLTAISLFIFPIYISYIFLKKHLYKVIFKISLIIFILIAPFVLRNILISGYLFFPVYQINVLNFKWKVPPDNLIEMTNVFKAEGIISSHNTNLTIKDRINLKILDRFSLWINTKGYIGIINKIILILIVLITLFYICVLFFFKFSFLNNNLIWILAFVFIISIIIWSIQSPHYRYILHILLFNFIFFISAILYSFLVNSKNLIYISCFSLLLTILPLFIDVKFNHNLFHNKNLIQPFSNWNEYIIFPSLYDEFNFRNIFHSNSDIKIPYKKVELRSQYIDNGFNPKNTK